MSQFGLVTLDIGGCDYWLVNFFDIVTILPIPTLISLLDSTYHLVTIIGFCDFFAQFSSSFAPKNGPLVQFIVKFSIKIQEKRELSSVQVPKNQVNFMNLVL